MKRRLPGIRQLSSGRYQANAEVWRWKDGKLVPWKPRKTFDTQREAQQWRLTITKQYSKANQRFSGKADSVPNSVRTIQDLIDYYYSLDRFRSAAPETKRSYRIGIRDFSRFCISNHISFLEQFVRNPRNGEISWAQRYVDYIKERHTWKGITKKIRIASMLFVAEIDRPGSELRRNPFKGLKFEYKSNPIKRKRFMSQEELVAILGVMSYEIRLRFLLLFGSSMRTREVRYLQPHMRIARDVIDLSLSEVFRTKTDGPTLRLLSPQAVQALDELIELNRGPNGEMPKFVLLGDRPANKLIFWNPLRIAIEKARKATGLELSDISPHKFRKTFLSWMAQQGADLAAIRDVAGHKSIKTTEESYAFLHPDYLRAQVAKVPLVDLSQISNS